MKIIDSIKDCVDKDKDSICEKEKKDKEHKYADLLKKNLRVHTFANIISD